MGIAAEVRKTEEAINAELERLIDLIGPTNMEIELTTIKPFGCMNLREPIHRAKVEIKLTIRGR